MGFPRILSKNNKIYTKLGEFCLSSDGNQFYFLCYTCQQELRTQETFWKHIQDEHSFMHHLRHEIQTEHKCSNQIFIDGPVPTMVEVPPPNASLVTHYKKNNDKNDLEHDIDAGADDVHDNDEDEEQEPKDYTEMCVIEPSACVEVNIKMEQSQPATELFMPTTAATVAPAAALSPQMMSYASILQNMPHIGGAHIIPVAAAGPPPLMAAHEPVPKDSSSATSEDGERWFICEYDTCGLKFKYQSRLELHRSVHSKVRRFACDMCNASFKQYCNLSTHRKKKHNIKGAKFESRF